MEIKQRRRTGFTLIELLVAMSIIAILVAVGLGSYTSIQIKARDAKRKNDLESISRALELYYNDYGKYPLVGDNKTIKGCGTIDAQGKATESCEWGEQFVIDETNTYMSQLPTDPKGHLYFYQSDGKGYQLYARLENTSDSAVAVTDTGDLGKYGTISCTGGSPPYKGCNYGVHSSNTSLLTVQAE